MGFVQKHQRLPSAIRGNKAPVACAKFKRLLEPIGNIPPAEAEARYYAQIEEPPWRRDSNETVSGKLGAVQIYA